MNTTVAALLASAMIAAPLAVASGGFPGLPSQAEYGHCVAYQHADEDARSNSTALANASYEDTDCEELKPQPQDGHADEADEHRQDGEARDDGRAYGEAQASEHRPDHAGGEDDAEAEGEDASEEHRQDDAAREDGRSYGQERADEHR